MTNEGVIMISGIYSGLKLKKIKNFFSAFGDLQKIFILKKQSFEAGSSGHLLGTKTIGFVKFRCKTQARKFSAVSRTRRNIRGLLGDRVAVSYLKKVRWAILMELLGKPSL